MKQREHDTRCAFHFDLHAPSIFVSGTRLQNGDFAALGPTGNSRSQIATRAVIKVEKRTGRSPGSISGLSKAADDLIEQWQINRRRGAYAGKGMA